MPRGGSRKPDGSSPHKMPDGRVLTLQKSSKSKTDYFCIVKVGNLFYPKLKLDEEKGSGAQKLFANGKKTAREAAIVLADFLDTRYELPTAEPRKPRNSELTELQLEEKKLQRLAELTAEANGLLGVSQTTAQEEAELEAEARDFAAWREARRAAPVLVSPVLVELGDHGDFRV